MSDSEFLAATIQDLEGHRVKLTGILRSRLDVIGAVDMTEVAQLRREINLITQILAELSALKDNVQ